MAVHDASVLAQQVDATVMAVRWGDTKTATLVAALQRMADLDIPVKGLVLSMIDEKQYGLYGHPESEIFSRQFRKYYPT